MSSPSIVVRAALTDAEWAEIQKQAIDLRCRPSELIGKTLRETLRLSQPKEQTAP